MLVSFLEALSFVTDVPEDRVSPDLRSRYPRREKLEVKGGGKIGAKGPGIRRVLLFCRSYSLRGMRFPRRLEGSIDVAGGHREDKGRGRGREEEAWYARAVVWMRGLEFDPESETKIEGTR